MSKEIPEAELPPEAKKDIETTIPLDGALFDKLDALALSISDKKRRKLFEEIVLKAKERSLGYTLQTLQFLSEPLPSPHERREFDEQKIAEEKHDENLDSHELISIFAPINLLLQSVLKRTRLDIGKEDSHRKTADRFGAVALQYATSSLNKYRALVEQKGEKPEEAASEIGFTKDKNAVPILQELSAAWEKIPQAQRDVFFEPPK